MLMLLKLVILVKREKLIKITQPYEYIVSLIFKSKMQVPITLLLFWITQDSRASPYFLSKKYIAFGNIRNCLLKREREFRTFYLFVKQFVCNLKITLRNSVIRYLKVLNISVVGCTMLWWWIKTEPLNKFI